MCCPALLLIAWASLTAVAATPTPSPVSHIEQVHLQDPNLQLSSLRPQEDKSQISPDFFSDSGKSMIVPTSQQPKVDFQKVSEDVRSSANPASRNGASKALSGIGVMNSAAKEGSLPQAPTNHPPQGNKKDGDKMTHLSTDQSHRNVQVKQMGNGLENGTLVYDPHHHTHYVAPLYETDAVNDTIEQWYNRSSDESSSKDIGKTTQAKTNGNDYSQTVTPVLNVQNNPFYQREYKVRSGDIHSTAEFNKNNEKTLEVNPLKYSNEKDVDSQKGITRDYFNRKSTNVSIFNDTINNVHFNNKEFSIHKIKTNITEENSIGTSSSAVLNATYSDPVEEIKHFQKSIDRNSDKKFHLTLETSVENITHSNAPMQQDGTHFGIVLPKNDFTVEKENGEAIEKFSNEFNKNENFFRVIPNLSSSPVVTTADSHMNDPPFKGPNVPREMNTFYKEVEKKIDNDNPVGNIKTRSYQFLNIEEAWKNARRMWGLAWDCHCYILGALFALIAFYSFVCLLRIKTFVSLLKSGYYATSNLTIFILCLLRSFYLIHDPYNLNGKLSIYGSRLLLKITLPILTTTFCLLFLALLNFTKTQLFQRKLQRPLFLILAVTFVFSLFISLEIVVGIFYKSRFLYLACYFIVVLCGCLSSICYLFIFKKLHRRALRKQGEMIRLTFTKMHIDGAHLPKNLPQPTLGLAVKLLLVSAIIQIVLCLSSPYAVVFLEELLPGIKIPDPWFWWGYHLFCRILELLMCTTLSFVATQPLKHFEVGNNRFCNILMWFPCSSFAECFQKEELLDFEAHSNNYANPKSLRSTDFNVHSRRLQTNSLPTFRTTLAEVEINLPTRTLPCSGRHTNHVSALSLLSYYRSKRTLSLSNTSGLEELERTLWNRTVSSSDGRNTLRPASMLYKDNGFIRFRRENDPEQPMEMSDDDEINAPDDLDTSVDDAESTKANVGSSFPSLQEGDFVQNTLSPFFQIKHKKQFRKMSRVSIETADYSADVSSDQLSNVVNLRNALSSSGLDFNTRKYGSTCSSESAANSFDVTFFLTSNSSPEMQTSPTSTTPASLNICSAYRSETEDEKTSSVEGHEVMLRSVSPIVKRASSGRLSLNLNLHAATDNSYASGHVNVACGTEDITPDSAVYLDLHLSRENTLSPQKMSSIPLPLTPIKSSATSTGRPMSPETASASPSSTSQSLSELRTSNSYVIPRIRKNSRGLLCKLRGSTFSLNTASYGYEPLELVESNGHLKNYKKCRDRRPLSEGQLELHPKVASMGDIWYQDNILESAVLGDSGLLRDCGITLVDVASQTDDFESPTFQHQKNPEKSSKDVESQSVISPSLIVLRK